MKGRVIGQNLQKGMIAVLTDGGISVMELIGGYEVELEDEIVGDLESHGGEVVENRSQGQEMDVSIEGVHCTRDNAMHLMDVDYLSE